jgi:hypothetical protein
VLLQSVHEIHEIRCPVPTKIDKQVSDKSQGENFSWLICVLGSRISVKTLVPVTPRISLFHSGCLEFDKIKEVANGLICLHGNTNG